MLMEGTMIHTMGSKLKILHVHIDIDVSLIFEKR